MEKEVRTPNQEKVINQSNVFNAQFMSYLTKVGWTNKDVQRDFIALINSIVLSAEDMNSQRMMINYLEKGLQILNVELQKIDITKQNKIDVVDPETVNVDDGQQVQTESVTQRDLEKVQDKEKLKLLIDNLKQNLKANGVSDEKIKEILKITFTSPNKDESQPKLLLGMYEEKCNKIMDYFDNKKVLSENEEEETVEQPIQPTQEQPQDDTGTDEKEVVLNNFKTFFKNYTVDEQDWTPELSENFRNTIINFVDMGSGDGAVQSKMNTLINNVVTSYKRAMGAPQNDTEPSNNFVTAKNELQKYATMYKKWNTTAFDSFFRNISYLAENTTLGKTQRFVLTKLNDVLKSLKKS
jgi:hypothetical protein